MTTLRWPLLAAGLLLLVRQASGASCPGTIKVPGLGDVAIVPTGWGTDSDGENVKALVGEGGVSPQLGGRAYFAESCTAGKYDHTQYSGPNLLGKTMRFVVDLAEAGCGCNAALYLTSMKQNPDVSTCEDYYCDANNVCGVSCAEIDIMEANLVSWHSTLHTSHDKSGIGAGYGGGGPGWNGPRDWSPADYGPNGNCIQTSRPFEVAVSFPVNAQGSLSEMKVELFQTGTKCPLSISLSNYVGMGELSGALKAGMTPIASFWSSTDMLWMDGKGPDGQGPCANDPQVCGTAVKMYNFSITPTGGQGGAPPPPDAPAVQPNQDTCPGNIDMAGHGAVSIVSAAWNVPGEASNKVLVQDGNAIVPLMKGRSYFASSCAPGVFDHMHYIPFKLLGKTLRYTTDLSGAGCGCNAALYLTSLYQNQQESECKDYYCDANNVCGVSCDEIDIQEANKFAWHSTLHTLSDHVGVGGGYGGGANWQGPRDWTPSDYAPGARCIDTTKPFDVAVSFPIDAAGSLVAMEIQLSQLGQGCPLSLRLGNYQGLHELSRALKEGMTPIISYWSSGDMQWMDGKGTDGQGPCATDDPGQCGESVKFYNFSIGTIGSPAPVSVAPSPPSPTPAPTPPAPADQEPDDGFCCIAATDTDNFCGTCFPSAHARPESLCGKSKAGCEACGGKAQWCTPEDVAAAPAPPPPQSTEPFCCLAAEDWNDFCGTCWPGAVAGDSSHCGGTMASCHACGGHATWCNGGGGSPPPAAASSSPSPSPEQEQAPTRPPDQCSDEGEDCRGTHCCRLPDRQCYQKNEWWAGCKAECVPGVDNNDPPAFRTPWSCTALGPRSPPAPSPQGPANMGWLFILIAFLTPAAAVGLWMKQRHSAGNDDQSAPFTAPHSRRPAPDGPQASQSFSRGRRQHDGCPRANLPWALCEV